MTGGPNAMAAAIEDELDSLNARLEVAGTRRERRALNKRIHALKGLLAWCKTRVGYRGMTDGPGRWLARAE